MSGRDYSLRKKPNISIFEQYNMEEEDLQEEHEEEYRHSKSRPKRKCKSRRQKMQEEFQVDLSEGLSQQDIFDSNLIVDRLPSSQAELNYLYNKVKSRIQFYKEQFLQEQEANRLRVSHVGQNSIPICADITNFDWDKLIDRQKKIGNRMFDIIMMDPPWKLSTSQPSRGVAIKYDSLNDESIEKIPIDKLQKNGFIFIWTINAKLAVTLDMMKKWKYEVVDSIAWTKCTINQKIAKGHGFYLQHAKETCIIGVKGKPNNFESGVASDFIFSQRRGQSQKPTQIYEYIQKLVPNGYFLEIFGRRNNLRDKWVTIGNEI